jgi:hypothetical protein
VKLARLFLSHEVNDRGCIHLYHVEFHGTPLNKRELNYPNLYLMNSRSDLNPDSWFYVPFISFHCLLDCRLTSASALLLKSYRFP